MTTSSDFHPLIRPFPAPGGLVTVAYRDLGLAATGTLAQRAALGNPDLLPRPWDPATCVDPDLRLHVWEWLEAVVIWLNHEYTWDVAAMIPTCWPSHPHLVHEIAGIAGQRRTAGLALTGDLLEEWHRYALPAFLDRVRTRAGGHCEEDHRGWPGSSRHIEHIGDSPTATRHALFVRDVGSVGGSLVHPTSRLGLVDLDSGVLLVD